MKLTKLMGVRLEPRTLEALKAEAKRQDVPMSQMVRKILKAWLTQTEAPS